MAFIRMRSPSKAPPVFRFDGSMEMMAMVLSLRSARNLRTISSTSDDFPAPPVPVIPRTGIFNPDASFSRLSKNNLLFSGKFSAADISPAISLKSLFFTFSTSNLSWAPTGKSHFTSKSLIIPWRVISRPSSGEYMRAIPYACNSLLSCGRITPPPPPKIRM